VTVGSLSAVALMTAGRRRVDGWGRGKLARLHAEQLANVHAVRLPGFSYRRRAITALTDSTPSAEERSEGGGWCAARRRACRGHPPT